MKIEDDETRPSNDDILELSNTHVTGRINIIKGDIKKLLEVLVRLNSEKSRLEIHEVINKALEGE